VRAAAATMLPSVPASHGLPLPRPLGLVLPADSWTWGQNLAHDIRCAAEAKRPMSTPSSAINSWAAARPTAVIASSWAHLLSERGGRLLDGGVQGGDLLAVAVDVVQHHRQDRRVVVGDDPRSASSSPTSLARSRRWASCASTLGSRCPAIKTSGLARSTLRRCRWRPS
jgi:hypothetical protein